MGNGGLISSITRDGREIEITSTEEAPVNEGDKAEITAPEYKSSFKFKYWDLAYGDINLNRNERTQVITVNKSDIRLNAVAALKLDIGLKRYVNNICSPLASDIYTTPKVHVYAKLPNKMLGKSEYKLWKLEKDENSTDTVLTEIDTSHTKLNTPYFTGSFDFT